MRAFAQYRILLIENKDLRKELRTLDEKINKIFKYLLEKIDALSQKRSELPKNKIGYKIG
jgi:phage-related protein